MNFSKPLNSSTTSLSTTQPIDSIKAVAVVGDELAISWDDGLEQYISLKTLRTHCPCARCAGEPDVMGKNELLKNLSEEKNPESFLMKAYQFIGGYALQFSWNDGHSSGIYSYRYLRQIENHS